MKKIPVIYSFARSGGTLVNQLLGTHPDCMVLSEVNPAASVMSVEYQAIEWLKLIKKKEGKEFSKLPYSLQIKKLIELAQKQGKTLIIRDWVTINYLPNVLSFGFQPSGLLEQQLYLDRLGYSMQPLIITRNASDVYYSIRKNFSQFRDLSVDVFAESYLAYAKSVSHFPKIKLESLQESPRAMLIAILDHFSLSTDYINIQLEKFSFFQNCTGNNTLAIPSKTANSKKVMVNKTEHLILHNNADFLESDRLFGYNI